MSTAAMMDRVAGPSAPADAPMETTPRTKARVAGALYLLTILGGVFAQGFVSDRLIDAGDAARTASNIAAHESLFRLGFLVFVVELGCQIATTVLLYELLAPAGRGLSRLAATFSLVGCTIKTIARLFFYAPLLLLGGTHAFDALGPAQTQGLGLLLLKINDHGAAMAMVFFGVYAILKGWLIVRSTFLPRALGVLAMTAGVGWLAYLWPPLGYEYFPFIAALGLLGSVATIGWLLVVGVDDARWREQARAAATSIWR
jgi:hypothetical protein